MATRAKKKGEPKKAPQVVSQGNGGSLAIPTGLVPATRTPRLNLPKVQRLKGIKDIEKQAKQIEAQIPNILELVQTVLDNRDQVAALSPTARECLDPDFVESMEAGEAELLRLLHEEDTPTFRRAAWLAYLEYELSREAENRDQVFDIFAALAGDHLVVGNAEGTGKIRVYGVTYDVHPDSLFGDAENEKVLADLEKMTKAVAEKQKVVWQEDSKKLEKMGTLTVQQFLGGQPGRIFLRVPAEHVPDPKCPNDPKKGTWRSGGGMVLEVKESRDGEDQQVVVVQHPEAKGMAAAAGKIQDALTEAMAGGIFLLHKTLGWSKPPFINVPDTLSKDQRARMEKTRRKVQLLWHLTKRGLKFALDKEEDERAAAVRQTLKQEWASRATITPVEFFVEKKPGICLVSYDEDDWEDESNGRKVKDLFLLVERGDRGPDEDAVVVISLKEVPSHVPDDFLAGCLNQDFEEGDRFEGVKQPLQAILRKMYGLAKKQAQIAGSPVDAVDK